jgi:endogenous inhibitor of DNA gyrase (YacG/DUF329 family)
MASEQMGKNCVSCGEDDWYKRSNGRPYCRPCAIKRSKEYYLENHYNNPEYRIKENTWKREQKRRKRAHDKVKEVS